MMLAANDPLISELLRAIGLDPAQCGDLTLTLNAPVRGIATLDLTIKLLVTPEQFRKISKVVGKSAEEIRDTMRVELFNRQTGEEVKLP